MLQEKKRKRNQGAKCTPKRELTEKDLFSINFPHYSTRGQKTYVHFAIIFWATISSALSDKAHCHFFDSLGHVTHAPTE
jgi:hypothetical protein